MDNLYFLITAYVLTAVAVVFLSNKASVYVDLIDKKTHLSGAFIGGVMLSAITSLPELFTSLSSTLGLGEAGLSMGNILGSNLFNLLILAVLIILFLKDYSKNRIAKGHFAVSVFVVLIYGAMLLNFLNVFNFEVLTVNLTSLVIIGLYILGIRFLSDENTEGGEGDVEDTSGSDLTIKQIIPRFILVAIGIVSISIVITFVTDELSEQLNLGKGLAGALFLGIATSLPELASTVSLFRLKNYNIAIGNILGSNLFNFTILSLTDIFYVGSGLFDFSDPKTVNLLIFGSIASVVAVALMKVKKGVLIPIACSVAIIVCYAAFLII